MKLENINSLKFELTLKFELMLYIFILQNLWFVKYEKLLQCKNFFQQKIII